MAVAVSGLAFATGAEAQQAAPRVTIAATYPTALEAIDPLVFDVTRSGAVDESLDVSVTVSSGIISERKLTQTVTIPAGEATVAFSVPTGNLAASAATGDVTATVDDDASYDVGDPTSASVRLYVGDPLVTVRFSEESYSASQSVGVVAGSRLIARTAPNVPAPNNAIPAAVGFQPGTATTPKDCTAGFLLLSFAATGWAADGVTFVARSTVPFTVIDDTEAEDVETLSMRLVKPPDAPDTVNFVSADRSGSECPELEGCSATFTILVDDAAPPNDEQGVHSGAVSITAKHPTALQGIDDLVFTVTRVIDLDSELEVPVTLSAGIIDADWLLHTVTIGANGTSAELRVYTRILDPDAITGDVVATADDGEQYDVPDPPTASVGSMGARRWSRPEDGDVSEDGGVSEDGDVSEVVVVSLVRVPDGTVIPDNSTVSRGGTVLDGSTFLEGERVWFRILLSAADGGPAPGGADVELSFRWHHSSPLVPNSGQISRVVFSLPTADVWDTAVQIVDNEVGNLDSTVTVRITGCERNGCVIGTPSQITATVADDDGGPTVPSVAGPDRPVVLCPDRGVSFQDTGLEVSWRAPDFEGGAPIEGYEVRYRRWSDVQGETPGYGQWQPWPQSGISTSTNIVGLDTDTSYGVQVRAVNANGPGEWSPEGTRRTGEPDHICNILDQLAKSE